jgi:sialate O-acetylesterase
MNRTQTTLMKHVTGMAAMLLHPLIISGALMTASAAAANEEEPGATLAAQCGLPFHDNGVLQQQIPLPVWGTSLPGAKVTLSFDAQTKTTVADAEGNWRIVLDPMTAVKLASVNDVPVGKTMTILCEKDGKNAVKKIENILIGEVWLCAGQSNMAGKMGGAGSSRHYPPDSIVKADYPALRQMVSPKREWLVCSPETAVSFKKVCFFFARRVYREVLVPVGVINAAVGGSKIESWLNQKPFDRGGHYDKMIAPLEGYGLRGVVWYQGESNERDGRQYQPKLESLITGWRKAWKQPDSTSATGPRGAFSVYFVQLPGIGKSTTDHAAGGDGRAEIRQACVEVLAIENTGMAVTIDIGDVREHPPNKYDTGVRLAQLALHYDYGFQNMVSSGPLYKSQKIDGSTVRITFDNAQNGLMLAVKEGFLPPKPTPDVKLSWLSIQGNNGTWHWADGKIEGSELVVSSKDVTEPIAVRYAYTQHPTGSLLYNKEGLPASPFSTNGYGDSKE